MCSLHSKEWVFIWGCIGLKKCWQAAAQQQSFVQLHDVLQLVQPLPVGLGILGISEDAPGERLQPHGVVAALKGLGGRPDNTDAEYLV